MRTLPDRIRHTLIFEALALTIVSLLGSKATGFSIEAIGTLGIFFSAFAMVWNIAFNWMFDLWDAKYRNSAPRGVGIRVVHALLFEAAFLIVGIFVIAWWLDITLWHALALDAGMATFFLAYAFCFNWCYDHIFPVPKAIPAE